MSRLLVALLLTGVAFASAARAEDPPADTPAQSAFTTLKHFCIDTRAVSNTVLALADSEGWQQLPQPALDQLHKSKEFADSRGRMMRHPDGSVVIVVVLHSADDILGSASVHGEMCAVGIVPAVTGADALVAQYAAIPITPGLCKESDIQCYLWREDGDRHIAVDEKSFDKSSGSADFLAYQSDSEKTVLLYGIAVVDP